MSIIDISPKQSLGPRSATRISTPRLLFLVTSISPSSTTNMACAGSPSRKMLSPGPTRMVSSCLERCSSTSSESAPKRPISRSMPGLTGRSGRMARPALTALMVPSVTRPSLAAAAEFGPVDDDGRIVAETASAGRAIRLRDLAPFVAVVRAPLGTGADVARRGLRAGGGAGAGGRAAAPFGALGVAVAVGPAGGDRIVLVGGQPAAGAGVVEVAPHLADHQVRHVAILRIVRLDARAQPLTGAGLA